EWFENHYRDVVLDELRARTAQDYHIEIDISAASETPANAASSPAEPQVAPEPPPPLPPLPALPPIGLSSRYRFTNFIKGSSNELAASAAWSVAQDPGARFNPFFIYGGVGLGKTHLLHAIGHHIHHARPHLRIVYQSAERFMNEFISAVRFNQFDQFRARY